MKDQRWRTMEGSAMGGSLSWRSSLLLIALLGVACQSQDGASSCTPAINVKRDVMVQQPGEPLDLQCFIRCPQESLNVTWCKVDETQNANCSPLGPESRISFTWEKQQGDEAVHLLQFNSLHIEDSGYYKCSTVYEQQKIVSGVIAVNVTAEAKPGTSTTLMAKTNSTMPATSSTPIKEQFRLLLYILVSAGGLCIMIITISMAVFCHRRRRKIKRSSRDPEPADEVEFVARPINPEHLVEHEKALSPPGQAPAAAATETTYDNAHLKRVPSSPSEDSVVYADLNHDSKRTPLQLIEYDEVEYATVHLH